MLQQEKSTNRMPLKTARSVIEVHTKIFKIIGNAVLPAGMMIVIIIKY